MKRLFSLLAAVGLVLALNSAAQASFLSSILANGLNTFEDQDREAYVDVNGNATFDVGDVLTGFVRLDDHAPPVNGVGPINNRIYAIFSQQVVSITPIVPGLVVDIQFAPTTAAGLTLSDLTGVATPAGGIVAVYSDFTAITDLVNTSPGDRTGNGTTNLFDYFDEITDEMMLTLVAGFGAGVTEADDYFEALAIGPGALLTTPGGAGPGVALIPSSVTLASFDAGLSILFNADANVVYNEAVVSSNLTIHDLAVSNGAVRGSFGNPLAPEYGNINPDLAYTNPGGFDTDADFFVNVTVIPEPGSFILMALGVATFGGARLRKRKQLRS
jgi:hypothetical protein